MTLPTRSEPPYPQPWTCAGCQSWTEELVPVDELLTEWGWASQDEDGHTAYYCPECK